MAKKKPVITVAPKQAVVETFEMKDTTIIQLESLVNFMTQLGYKQARANGGFVTDNPVLKANRNISSATAIKLHNMKRKDWLMTDTGWHFPGFDIKLNLFVAPVAFNMLQASKIVKKVKFLPTRKGLMLQSHMVKPVDKVYGTLLGFAE